MTEQELERLAIEFLQQWAYYQRLHNFASLPFEKSSGCKKIIDMGLLADHLNPHVGEYAIRYTYTGIAFFTGSGELTFTEQGLPFVKKVCGLCCKHGSHLMQVIKVEY
ncbi:MAG: hypothetical protein Q8R40_00080 [bacterium]|nr:hypothetical protein [bacterium]